MTKTSFTDKENHHIRLLVIGTVLFVVYYLTDCALDSLLFGEETFAEQLLSPSVHEVAIRVLSGAFLFFMYVAASLLLNKNKRLKEDLKKKTQELLTRTQELEAYNYALSNDLGASLTRVIVAKDILYKKCSQCSNGVCRGLVEQIAQSSDTLSDQIDGMLSYSEMNRTPLERRPVAIDNIAREIAKEIAANTTGESLDIQIDNRLEVDCDPELIYVALKNLIENAVSDHAPDHVRQVEIGAAMKNGTPVYYIRDNGRGLEQADCEQMFRPFEKPPEPLPKHCTGFGLATTKTIIERHGGKIWAESQPEKGTTVYFTLDAGHRPNQHLN
jgi:light-regulated signal transduction histidine kinase (bacteriophytochrome)